MSSITASGRAILNGLAEGGYPLKVGSAKAVVHTAIEGSAQLDTVYVYAFVCRRSSGTVASVTVEATVLNKNNSEYVLSSLVLPGLPCTAPTLVVNGQVKNNGARLRIRAVDGEIGVFGWYNRSTISVPPSVRTVVGSLALGYQILSFSSDDEIKVIDTTLPVTFISTSHTTSNKCRATLAASTVGGVKFIIMVSRNPSLTDATLGNCTVVPSASRFPRGEQLATGTLTFSEEGDSAMLIWTGSTWMILGSGALVD